MCLFQQEETHDCFVVIGGYAPSMEAPDRIEGIALVWAEGFVQSVFGYPNEEAYQRDPRGALGPGFFEIVGSQWFANIDSYNTARTGADGSRHSSPGPSCTTTSSAARTPPARSWPAWSRTPSQTSHGEPWLMTYAIEWIGSSG
jgi:hypothetical protein